MEYRCQNQLELFQIFSDSIKVIQKDLCKGIKLVYTVATFTSPSMKFEDLAKRGSELLENGFKPVEKQLHQITKPQTRIMLNNKITN